jgi:hypothetical protein
MNSSWQDKGITAIDMAKYFLYSEEDAKFLIEKYSLKIDAKTLADCLNDEVIGWAIGDEISYNQHPTKEDEKKLIKQLKNTTIYLLKLIEILEKYGNDTMILFELNNLDIYKIIDKTKENLTELRKHIFIAESNSKDRVTYSILNAAGQERYSIDSAGGVTEQRFDKNGRVIFKITYATAVENPEEVAKQPVDQVDKYIIKDEAYDFIHDELLQKRKRLKKPKGNQTLLFWHTFIKYLARIYERYTDKKALENISHKAEYYPITDRICEDAQETYRGDFLNFVNDCLNIFNAEQPNDIRVREWKSSLELPKSLGKLIMRVLNPSKSN